MTIHDNLKKNVTALMSCNKDVAFNVALISIGCLSQKPEKYHHYFKVKCYFDMLWSELFFKHASA